MSSSQEVLAPFLACASPAEFIALQREVDMARLVEGLDGWSAVRLGSLGPLRDGSDALNRKRAAFLFTATREYGAARAELFALFIIHSAFTDDLHQVLLLLARDKHLAETLGRMGAVGEALRQRGLNLGDYKDRPEHLGDVARGLASAANEALSTSELRRGALAMKYDTQRGQLPPLYQQALDEVERAELERAFSPESVALGSLDALTFGVPVGFFNLVAGTCHGVYSLSQGQYEQATRELSAATVLVALYAGGKGARYLSEGKGPGWRRVGQLQVPELGFEGLAEVAERLWMRLGRDGIHQLARHIQASREAALLVHEGGEAGAVALYEARGNVARAQAWLSEAKSERAGRTSTTETPIRNAHLAGRKHPVTHVPFDADGYPDFRAAGVVEVEVKISFTGSRVRDFAAANKAAGFKETPKGMTWHHHQDGTTLQLVPTGIHARTGHTGGFSGGQ
ncbi:HNH endonuclease [Archangium violaceum]|uniref:HNH endonuclease n=1 Tax=Archangium violaceum TaxID=83451 RepID=UPI001EF53939|nr:HNH endonuclease [Archangium violaceum]